MTSKEKPPEVGPGRQNTIGNPEIPPTAPNVNGPHEMKTSDAIKHFGGMRKLAAALRIWPQAIYAWGEHPPKGRQCELEVITNGALRAGGGDHD